MNSSAQTQRPVTKPSAALPSSSALAGTVAAALRKVAQDRVCAGEFTSANPMARDQTIGRPAILAAALRKVAQDRASADEFISTPHARDDQAIGRPPSDNGLAASKVPIR